LKGKFYKSASGIMIRKYMVAFQYVLSIFLIAGTITIYRQLSYMEKTDRGYAKDQILVLKAPAIFDSTFNSKIQYLKNELKQSPSIRQVTVSSDIPGSAITDRNKMRKTSQESKDGFITYIQGVDPDFVSTFDVPLIAGRTFAEGESMNPLFRRSDGPPKPIKVLINEVVAKNMGFENAEDALHEKIAFA
jgi:putative ABC transport system permease protein